MEKYIVISRSAQGYEEWAKSSEEERLDVVRRWQVIKADLDRKCEDKSFFAHRKHLKEEKQRPDGANREESLGHSSHRQSSFRDVFGSRPSSHSRAGSNDRTIHHHGQSTFSNSKLPPAFPTYPQRSWTEQGEVDNDTDIQRALEASRREHMDVEERGRREKAEMDIVMEYAKKQSLAEEAFKKQSDTSAAGGSGSGSGSLATEEDEDYEEMRRAIEESLRFQ